MYESDVYESEAGPGPTSNERGTLRTGGMPDSQLEARLTPRRGHGVDGAPQPALPVVVLLDIKLPRVKGLEMRKVIRSNQTTQDVRVVTLTLLDETA